MTGTCGLSCRYKESRWKLQLGNVLVFGFFFSFGNTKNIFVFFSVDRQAGWLHQSRLWFCFSLTSLLLHSSRCWAMGRTRSRLHQAGVSGEGGAGKQHKNKTKWHRRSACACSSAKVFRMKEKKKVMLELFFLNLRLLLDGIQSTLEQHDLTLINAESYQGLKAASQAAHIPCVQWPLAINHWTFPTVWGPSVPGSSRFLKFCPVRRSERGSASRCQQLCSQSMAPGIYVCQQLVRSKNICRRENVSVKGWMKKTKKKKPAKSSEANFVAHYCCLLGAFRFIEISRG